MADLLDLLERDDIRSEILKELDRQQQKLLQLQAYPTSTANASAPVRITYKRCATTLIMAPRLGQLLREDRLVGAQRQRFSIPGDCCSLDLPALHL